MAKPRRTGPRASWKGELRIDLVSFAVEATNAVESSADYHFHQLHKTCHSRVHYQKTCPIHGPVDNDDIVLGYEYKKNQYVEIDPEELDRLRTKSEKALTLDTFIEPDELDPMYYDGRSYILIPARAELREPYALVAAALDKMQRDGVGQIVFSGREQLVVVRPKEGTLIMQMLHHAAEFRQLSDFAVPKAKLQPKKIELAATLIDAATEAKFDISDYTDRYQERVRELIDLKKRGQKIVTPDEENEPRVINLMEALRQSVAKAKGQRSSRSKATKKKSAHTAARRRKRAS